jgi:hypothetical protein
MVPLNILGFALIPFMIKRDMESSRDFSSLPDAHMPEKVLYMNSASRTSLGGEKTETWDKGQSDPAMAKDASQTNAADILRTNFNANDSGEYCLQPNVCYTLKSPCLLNACISKTPPSQKDAFPP